MSSRTKQFLLAAAASTMVPCTALAYQAVKVSANGAEIHSGPKSNTQVVKTVNAGTALNISDKPTNGFYRCSGAGVTGWIAASDVGLSKRGPASYRANTSTSSGYSSSNSTLDHNFYVGGVGGLGMVSGGMYPAFGADFNYKVMPNLGLGMLFSYIPIGSASGTSTSSSGATTATGSASASMMLFAAEGNLFFLIPGFHVGAKAGLARATVSGTATATGAGVAQAQAAGVSTSFSTSASAMSILFGAGAGYDFPIAAGFTVGAEGDFLIASGTAISGFATVKYWF